MPGHETWCPSKTAGPSSVLAPKLGPRHFQRRLSCLAEHLDGLEFETMCKALIAERHRMPPAPQPSGLNFGLCQARDLQCNCDEGYSTTTTHA